MSRTFWVIVGAAGGIYVYRRGTRAVERARELGPMGSAQAAAQATSVLAGRAATGLGRLQEVRARREGRLLPGTVQIETPTDAATPAAGWVPAPERRVVTPGGHRPFGALTPAESARPEAAR